MSLPDWAYPDWTLQGARGCAPVVEDFLDRIQAIVAPR
jgi:hypothetical protein